MHKLLLADPSAMMHRIIELTFSRENVQVIAVGDGQQAIALLEVERPDIVLADHALPGRDGYAIAAFVKARPDLAHIPVLLLAGAFEPVDKARAAQVGCDGVLVKPFEPQQVIARVRELIDARATVDSAPPPPETTRASVLKLVEPISRERLASTPSTGRQGEGHERGESLDEYFDRLDVALGSLDSGHAAPQAVLPRRGEHDDHPDSVTDPVDLPTVDALLAGTPPPTSGPATVLDLHWSRSPLSSAVVPPGQIPTETPSEPAGTDFSALAKALGERGETRTHHEPPLPAARRDGPSDPLVVSDEMIDEITRRVGERLAPEAVSRVVSNIVTEVAERLVRQEIDRIRNK